MKRQLFRLATVATVLGFTLSLHYMLLPLPEGLHHALHATDLHRRLCYIPIILGALWFGLRGGMAVATILALAVAPLAWRFDGPLFSNPDFIEILFYIALGLLTGFLVTAKDRERENKERLQRELAAAERLAALGRASAGIAHEVRTPLGSIQGATEILGEDFPEGHPRRDFYNILVKECRRLGRVVDDFLDLGRPVALQMRPCRLGELLQQASDGTRLLAGERKVPLRIDRGSAPDLFVGDPDRLTQALVNLLRNAIQASPEGLPVTLTCAVRDGALRFEVGDGGSGIPAGEEERIFEPFFTGRRDGTGLGLPLARQVAVAHGGSLTGCNRPGGGALFVLTFPLRQEVAP